MKRKPICLSLMLISAPFSHGLEYVNDWSGNDWNGEPDASGEAQYVHGCGTQMFVAPDGAIYQGSTSGGDHGPSCMYDTHASYVRDLVNSTVTGDTYKTYLQGVTANSKYYYVSVRIKFKDFVANKGPNANGLPRVPADATRQWYTVARYNRSDRSPAPFPRGYGSLGNVAVILDIPSTESDRLPYLTGLAADENYLYVADKLNHKVIRLDANNPDPASTSSISWNFQNGTDLAVGKSGDVYALSEGTGGFLQRFSSTGSPLASRQFSGTEEPMAIAVDKTQTSDRVLVAMDQPAARQIWRYSSTLAKESWTLGTAGGAAPGVFPDSKKFAHIKGVGVDSSGQIYVLEYGPDGIGAPDSMENITRLQKFSSAGTRLWTREAHGWIDSPGFSKLDDGVMYSTTGKYRLDYSKMDGTGRSWIWEGHTFDPIAYPHDPRAHNSMFGADVVNLGGVEFLTTFSGGQRGLAVYRFASGVAVPTAIICPNAGGFSGAPSRPSTAWVWSDLDGGGDIDSSSEYTSASWKDIQVNKSYLDANGDFWGFSDSSTTSPKIYRIPFTGLTSSGIPKWNIAAADITSVASLPGAPSPLTQLGEGVYDPATDKMYLGVFTERSPNNSGQGEVIYQEIWCYKNWSTSPAFAWSRILEKPWTTGGGPHDLELAGDYLFVGDSASADSGTTSVDDQQIRMYQKVDGAYVGTLLPPKNDKHLDYDRARSIRPHLRSNGSYIVGTESFRTQKTQLYYIPVAGGTGNTGLFTEDFESGSHKFTSMSQVQIGSNGAAQGTLPAGSTLTSSNTLAVPAKVPAGTTSLTVQTDVRLPAAEVGNVVLEMILSTKRSDGTAGKLFGGRINVDPAFVGEWLTYQATVAVPSDVVSIEVVRVKFGQTTASAGANTVQIDNVKVE